MMGEGERERKKGRERERGRERELSKEPVRVRRGALNWGMT